MRTKVIATVLSAALLIGIAVVWALTRRQPEPASDPGVTVRSTGTLVRDTKTGQLAVVAADGTRRASDAICARAYAAAGRISCLRWDPQATTSFELAVLDEQFQPVSTLPVSGLPSRTRVSADGRMVAYTVFVSGDSYLASGYSTRTSILDLRTGTVVKSLEEFTVDGRKPPVDANFWGVSFAADDNTFYSTMATGPHFYLVRGDVAARTVTVLDDGVECPSLSPDGTRLVYKKRLPDLTWQLWVYDLRTKHRTQLAEPGTVDDQAAWVDDRTVMYGKVNPDATVAIWSVPADGTGSPRLMVPDAESPSVLR